MALGTEVGCRFPVAASLAGVCSQSGGRPAVWPGQAAGSGQAGERRGPLLSQGSRPEPSGPGAGGRTAAVLAEPSLEGQVRPRSEASATTLAAVPVEPPLESQDVGEAGRGLSSPVAATPDLAAVLAARDTRALFQAELAARWGGPVLSLTVVSPGPVKNSPRIDRVFTAAVKAVAGLLADRGWRALERCRRLSAAGPELLMAVEANPAALKSALADLEDLHPLGRLWDADVLKAGRPLSRAAVGRPRRRCLVCGAAAAPCARSRRHSLAELDAAVEALLFHG